MPLAKLEIRVLLRHHWKKVLTRRGAVKEICNVEEIGTDLYCQQLDRVYAALTDICPTLVRRKSALFQQDNARPNTGRGGDLASFHLQFWFSAVDAALFERPPGLAHLTKFVKPVRNSMLQSPTIDNFGRFACWHGTRWRSCRTKVFILKNSDFRSVADDVLICFSLLVTFHK